MKDKRVVRNNTWFIYVFVIAYILSFAISIALIGSCMHSVVNEDVAWCEKL